VTNKKPVQEKQKGEVLKMNVTIRRKLAYFRTILRYRRYNRYRIDSRGYKVRVGRFTRLFEA
jgi:hypothetical protein